jgi:isoprenylcysteine carboxyl methyltransferase (ICMT) family protein YpbQ
MSTTVLAYVILFMGFITFLGGLWGVMILIFEEVAKTGRVPFRYYAMMVGLISGGLAMIGVGQALRLLLLIIGKP